MIKFGFGRCCHPKDQNLGSSCFFRKSNNWLKSQRIRRSHLSPCHTIEWRNTQLTIEMVDSGETFRKTISCQRCERCLLVETPLRSWLIQAQGRRKLTAVIQVDLCRFIARSHDETNHEKYWKNTMSISVIQSHVKLSKKRTEREAVLTCCEPVRKTWTGAAAKRHLPLMLDHT